MNEASSNVLKGMILAVLILYVLSPIDVCPGPVDDIIVVLIGMAGRKIIDTRE